jgi:hypothetical protein
MGVQQRVCATLITSSGRLKLKKFVALIAPAISGQDSSVEKPSGANSSLRDQTNRVAIFNRPCLLGQSEGHAEVWSELEPGRGRGTGEWKPERNIADYRAAIIQVGAIDIAVAVGSRQIQSARARQTTQLPSN